MADATIESIEPVGSDTIAIELRTPPDFVARPGQFILVRAEIDGEEETGYYTLSSPNVEETFEITVAVDPDGTLGPWLERRKSGESIRFEGPYGDVTYDGQGNVAVLSKGPGIGPAVGIAERAIAAGETARILCAGDVSHEARLDALRSDGADVVIEDEVSGLSNYLRELSTDTRIYVFGFDEFVGEAENALEDAGFDTADVAIENFGPA